MPAIDPFPTLEEFAEARECLGDRVRTTPVWQLRGGEVERRLGADTEVFLKLELLQHAGTFKPRGALMNMLALDAAALEAGVTGVSAGNHAIAVGYAASVLGTTAKVVMPKTANAARIRRCRELGTEVVFVDDVHVAFAEVHRIEREEGRSFIHPFDGRRTVLGTGTVGWELARQVEALDAVIVPIGGGGLCAGVSAAVKLAQPACSVYGVEPVGADTMHRSFASGKPEAVDRIDTIADSLAAPHAELYSFSVCHEFVDELVLVDDDMIRSAMGTLFTDAKLAVEPAGAAATAAMLGPLQDLVRGRRVGVIVCGTNIDAETFCRYLPSD